MNIKESRKLKFLQDWRQDHLSQMHWAATSLRDGIETLTAEGAKNLEDYIRWCGQRAFELKGMIDKLERQ